MSKTIKNQKKKKKNNAKKLVTHPNIQWLSINNLLIEKLDLSPEATLFSLVIRILFIVSLNFRSVGSFLSCVFSLLLFLIHLVLILSVIDFPTWDLFHFVCLFLYF